MNGKLRKEINYKNNLKRIWARQRTKRNGNKYRVQNNKVTALKRQAITNYFTERCAGGPKSKEFWPTIKAFLSKNSKFGQDICLLENDSVVSDTKSV